MKIRQKESLPQPSIKLTTPGHESDMLTTEPPGRGSSMVRELELSPDDEYPPTTPCQEIGPCYRVSTWSDMY